MLTLFATTPLSIFVNGDIAVRYFFVLTGFLVGMNCLNLNKLDNKYILKKSCNRYFRLLPVCFIATLFTAFTMYLGIQRHLDIVDIAINGEFLLDYCNFRPTVLNTIYNLILKPFLTGSDFVGPFWTICYEMWGYIVAMIAVWCLGASKLRRLAYVLISGIFIGIGQPNYVGFFIGLFVADLIYRRDDSTFFSRFYHKWLYKKSTIICLSIIGLYFAACPLHLSSIYAMFQFLPDGVTLLFRSMGCGILIFCLSQSEVIYKIFEMKPLIFLGEHSFAIYAFHWPLMLTLEAWLFWLFQPKMSYDAAAISSFVITIPIIILVAFLVHLVEKRIRISSDKLIDITTL